MFQYKLKWVLVAPNREYTPQYKLTMVPRIGGPEFKPFVGLERGLRGRNVGYNPFTKLPKTI